MKAQELTSDQLRDLISKSEPQIANRKLKKFLIPETVILLSEINFNKKIPRGDNIFIMNNNRIYWSIAM